MKKKRKISEKQRRQGSRNFLKGRLTALRGEGFHLIAHSEIYSHEREALLRALFEIDSLLKNWLVLPPFVERN